MFASPSPVLIRLLAATLLTLALSACGSDGAPWVDLDTQVRADTGPPLVPVTDASATDTPPHQPEIAQRDAAADTPPAAPDVPLDIAPDVPPVLPDVAPVLPDVPPALPDVPIETPDVPLDVEPDVPPVLPDVAPDIAPDIAPDVPPTGPVWVDLGEGVTSTPAQLSPGEEVTLRYEGALAWEDDVWLHYGFDGWNYTGDGSWDWVEETDDTNNRNYFQRTPMTRVAAGRHELTLTVPEGARAIHFVFFVPRDDADWSWDNNDTLDWGRGAPFPFAGPWLTWNAPDQPARGVVVSFQSGHACAGRVDYGTTEALGEVAEEGATGAYHHVVLNELLPDTRYHYRVACGALEEPQSHTFRTAPAESDELTFLVLGDMQEDGEHRRWYRTAGEIVANHLDETQFAVIAGDLAWNDKPGEWWTFFDGGRGLLSELVVMPVAGNHDTPSTSSNTDTSSFERRFLLGPSGTETWYQFRWGDAHFLAFDSERPDDFANDGGAQYEWAHAALTAPTTPPTWTFAYWHKPPYNAGERHFGDQGTYRDITALFDGALDWHFAGHVHLYQRMRPLRYSGLIVDGYGRGADQGAGYVVVPPAGSWPSDRLIPASDGQSHRRDRLAYPPNDWNNDTVASEIGFTRVDISGRSFTLTTFGMGTGDSPTAAHEVDRFSYDK